MRPYRWVIGLIVVLLSACSTTQQAEQPTSTPAAATTFPLINPSTTSAPSATLAPSATFAPSATPASTNEPTADLFRADPTAMTEPTADATNTADSATPTSIVAPTDNVEAGQPSEPARIVIAAVDIDQKIISVGLDKNRVPIVPDHDVGWYNYSAEPSQGENIVLWGHVLRFRKAPDIPAPFARLKDVKPGAEVVLYDQKGTAHTYIVKQQIWVTPDEVAYILPQGKEMVTMVSCIGDKIITNGEVVDESHRLITIAEPVSE